ncbi:uncharacterized protein LOC142160698 isoform X2 [Mixophyes fleayi]|uniref:uncharacterized protein LOC142160698 isoform X2 n=1 Tax=Mixophyes fleayi TaxID=3061075 RepID=UPI003F4E327F
MCIWETKGKPRWSCLCKFSSHRCLENRKLSWSHLGNHHHLLPHWLCWKLICGENLITKGLVSITKNCVMSSAGKSMVPLDIVDARSPANQYLVRLLEDKGTITFQPLTEERIQLVFEVLDKVTPNLGVFSQVIALIRSELHGAVYSQTLPGSRPWIKSEGLIRLPFFSLVRRMQTDRYVTPCPVEGIRHQSP